MWPHSDLWPHSRHGGAYEDNIAMESFSPQRFETLVPHSYSGFLHRAGQLFSDADFGVKINNLKTEEEDREETPSGDTQPATFIINLLQILIDEKILDSLQSFVNLIHHFYSARYFRQHLQSVWRKGILWKSGESIRKCDKIHWELSFAKTTLKLASHGQSDCL